MDAKEYLSQAFYLNRQIKAKERKLEWLRDIAPGPSMRFTDEAKVPGNTTHSIVEDAAIRVVALEEEVAADILKLVETIKEIEAVIRTVEPCDCRTILEMRYLGFMQWDEIIDRMGHGDSYVFRRHREGLRKIPSNHLK